MSAIVTRRKNKLKRDYFHNRLLPTLLALEQEAHKVGLPMLGKYLNDTTNKSGFYFASILDDKGEFKFSKE